MALSSFTSNSAMKLPILPFSQTKHLFSGYTNSYLAVPRVPLSLSVLCLARRRTNAGRPITSKKKKQDRNRENSNKDGDLNEDAFEALFKQLEEDLKNDEQFVDDGEDEISEEDLAMLERELEEALAEDGDFSQLLNMAANDAIEGGGEDEEMEDEVVEGEEVEKENDNEEEDEPLKLRGWQLRRLAYALKVGRRKTSIKNLAAELCLDRAILLDLLRDPPPNLLMMCAALPDKPKPTITMPSFEATLPVPSEVITDSAEPEPATETEVETPIHVLQGSWSAQKRLKKVHISTLETVYRRTKRPTNAMISSIVQVTNLPRRRIVQWFEDKRAANGVPEQRRPYQRSSSESVFSQ